MGWTPRVETKSNNFTKEHLIVLGSKGESYSLHLWPFLSSSSGFVTVGGPMVGSLSKFAGGLMSDLTLLKLPRVWLITITNLCQAAVLTLCVFAADVPAITIVLAVVHYIGETPGC